MFCPIGENLLHSGLSQQDGERLQQMRIVFRVKHKNNGRTIWAHDREAFSRGRAVGPQPHVVGDVAV
jgi:hypothetical protein